MTTAITFEVLQFTSSGATYTGFTTPQPCTIKATKIGNVVTLSGTEALAAPLGSVIGVNFGGSLFPDDFWITNGADSTYSAPILVDDNQHWVMGCVNISNSGEIVISNTTDLAASGVFKGPNQSGPYAWNVTYIV